MISDRGIDILCPSYLVAHGAHGLMLDPETKLAGAFYAAEYPKGIAKKCFVRVANAPDHTKTYIVSATKPIVETTLNNIHIKAIEREVALRYRAFKIKINHIREITGIRREIEAVFAVPLLLDLPSQHTPR